MTSSSVLMSPAPTFDRSNAYLQLLAQHLEGENVTIGALTVKSLLRGHPDAVHLHWPDSAAASPSTRQAAYGCAKRLAVVQLSRWRGARVVWTAHNLHSHDNRHPVIERWFWRLFSRQVDVVLSLTDAGLPELRTARPGLRCTPTVVTRHGTYTDVYGPSQSATVARQATALPGDATVITFVGQVRPYKGVTSLIEAFGRLDDPAAHLLIAGRSSEEALTQEIRSRVSGQGNVTYRPGFVPDDELAQLLASASLVVLPYRDVFNSGSAMLALSYGRPVLVPSTSVFRELQREVGADWVHLFTGELTSSDLAGAVSTPPAKGAAPDLSGHSWDDIARQTLNAYKGKVAA